jgi:hypothetical protein
VCEYGIHYTSFSLDAKVLFSKFLQPIQEQENQREMALAAAFNWMPWLALGDVANIGQLTGLNAVQLIGMIIRAANNARMHKKNCRQFAQHLKLISNLLEQLSFSELTKREETREPLALFEESLRKAVVLVESCRDKSYLYLVAMGWVYVNKFREYEDEIDKYLKLIPLISLVEDSRVSLSSFLYIPLYPLHCNTCRGIYFLGFLSFQTLLCNLYFDCVTCSMLSSSHSCVDNLHPLPKGQFS